MMPPIDFYDLYDPPAPPPSAVDLVDESRGIVPIPIDQFVAELREIYGPDISAKSTWAKLRQVLDEVKALGVTSTAGLTVPMVARYVSARPPGQSSHTLSSLLSSLRSACSYAEASGYVRVSPFKVKKLSKWVRFTPPREHGHLSREDIRRILDRMKRDIAERVQWPQWRARRIYALTAIVAYCALRRNEALRLHVADVDLPGRVILIVPRRRLKTAASAAPVPMPEALVPILEDWLVHRLDGPPNVIVPATDWLVPTINRKSAWLGGCPGGKALDVFQEAAGRAGVTGVTLHMLRRSYATHAEFFGLGPAMIQRVLRHTTTKTSERWYRKADIPNMREIVKGIDF